MAKFFKVQVEETTTVVRMVSADSESHAKEIAKALIGVRNDLQKPNIIIEATPKTKDVIKVGELTPEELAIECGKIHLEGWL